MATKKSSQANGEVPAPPDTYQHTVCKTVLVLPEIALGATAVFCPSCNGHYPPEQFVPAVD